MQALAGRVDGRAVHPTFFIWLAPGLRHLGIGEASGVALLVGDQQIVVWCRPPPRVWSLL